MATASQQAAASELLKNEQFMKLFERALQGGSDGAGEADTASAAGLLASMPKEGDPKRNAWLENLQKKLQEESLKAAKTDLEQVHSDEQGQWMFILPTAGFCIKCTVAGGGKVFINVCQHERIAEPVPMTKAECDGLEEDEIRFRIPLSCGQARPGTDKSCRPCKVYDVIVSPVTLQRCAKDHEFRRFVAALCMQWIKQKYEPTLNADEFRNLNFKAKGQLEPQRIRLSASPKSTNAMHDEIKLPTSDKAPTALTQVGGTKGTGKLIEEVTPSPKTVVLASDVDKGACNNDSNSGAEKTNSASDKPSVLRVEKEGAYDWSMHQKPSQNIFFRDSVPASYAVELHIPTVQTIREVDVRVGAKKLECFYVDETDETDASNTAAATAEPEPFLGVVFDYPVSDVMEEAKFVRKTHRLRMRFTVQLPDETASPRTAPERDAAELEAQEQAAHRAAREAEWAQQQAQLERQREEEAQVMAERKGYVENLAAVQSGDIPPMIREEIDGMPREQLPAMLHRLEGRILKGDSVDKLLEALPPPVLDALIDYIREKLSLAPRKRPAAAAAASASSPKPKADEKKSVTAAAPSIEEGDSMRVEYNYAAKSEKLFGVAFHNRYLFALDN